MAAVSRMAAAAFQFGFVTSLISLHNTIEIRGAQITVQPAGTQIAKSLANCVSGPKFGIDGIAITKNRDIPIPKPKSRSKMRRKVISRVDLFERFFDF